MNTSFYVHLSLPFVLLSVVLRTLRCSPLKTMPQWHRDVCCFARCIVARIRVVSVHAGGSAAMHPAALVVLGLLLRGAQAAAAGNAGLNAAHAVRPLTSSSLSVL